MNQKFHLAQFNIGKGKGQIHEHRELNRAYNVARLKPTEFEGTPVEERGQAVACEGEGLANEASTRTETHRALRPS